MDIFKRQELVFGELAACLRDFTPTVTNYLDLCHLCLLYNARLAMKIMDFEHLIKLRLTYVVFMFNFVLLAGFISLINTAWPATIPSQLHLISTVIPLCVALFLFIQAFKLHTTIGFRQQEALDILDRIDIVKGKLRENDKDADVWLAGYIKQELIHLGVMHPATELKSPIR
ncbi:hypothetical protein [Endozoicomonas lisbonensis]|uniref:SMODS and SLOG-associating 2TM effector domain-containing protein n=1 Tax=Endozoicomonas lisbonensis TaxID=3120522 RepID=A0ABV2SPC2_9GAMM